MKKSEIIKAIAAQAKAKVSSKMKIGMSVVHYPEQIKFSYIKNYEGETIVLGICPIIEDCKEYNMKVNLSIDEINEILNKG